MTKFKVIALFGESGSGKDYLLKWILRNYPDKFNKIVSFTTRPQRAGEQNSKEYHFISQGEFLSSMVFNHQMIEFAEFNNWYYGTLKQSYSKDKINIGIFDPTRIKNLLMQKDFDILPIWIKMPDKKRLLNALQREVSPDCYEICRRFCADEKQFSRLSFDYEVFLNDNFDCDYYNILNLPNVVSFLEDKTT